MGQKNVIVIGGGIAGLAASIYLARGGHRVTVFERRPHLGGRAVTHLRRGYRFNLGPHAFYRGGPGWQVCRELGIPIRGGVPDGKGVAMLGSERYRFPGSPLKLLTTNLLPLSARFEAAKLFFRIRRLDPKRCADMTTRQWLDANVKNDRLRQTMEALLRLATYSDHAEEQSAAAALRQLKSAMRGVVYVDEGWQRIVDALHGAAVSAGVNFVTSSHIVGVAHDGSAVKAIALGELEQDLQRSSTRSMRLPRMADDARGTRLPATDVILAVDPTTVRDLVDGLDFTPPHAVIATCLDVALSSLPQPKPTFALGIDRPLYYSVHSAWAQLTPKGGALIHVAKYRKTGAGNDEELESTSSRRSPSAAADEAELEAVLDEMQPGWRERVVHRRFLPSMTVSNALVRPGVARPAAVTKIKGLYLAGDWVGDEGILSDAALASARTAAKAILASA
ncbi:MAG TPA: NAD(P)/FAD-dependent oxidoreductase [Thermoanaerobaculia bacterium]|nr:NAD(P)/FAD-dependent oxidoreductase [Thermoanaerobaculia bacterium]